MKKTILFFLFLLFCSIILNAQKIYYSPTEKSAYDNTGNHIIGKIKDNILVWKYIYPGRNFELLVYDYNMRLQQRVILKAFHSFSYGDNLSFDFINRQNYFDVIVQYNSDNIFYCKAARFDENGALTQPVKTIESLNLKEGSEKSFANYSLVQSENKKYAALANAVSEVDGTMEVSFLIIDKNLNCIKKGNTLLPFNSTRTVLSSVCLDNNGNLLLAEASNVPSLSSNMITVYKIERNNDTVSNIVHDVGKKLISDLSMKVDDPNNEYFVSALVEDSDEKTDSTRRGMFSILLNTDLTEKASDHFSILNDQEKDTTKNENAFINGIVRNDSGYVVVCFAAKETEMKGRYFAGGHAAYNFDAQSFYRQPNNSSMNQINYNTLGTPGLPIYHYQATGPQRGNEIFYEEAGKDKDGGQTTRGINNNKRLILLYVSNKNEHTRSLIVTDDFDNTSLFDLGFSKILNVENELHVIFPRVIKEKGMLGQFILTPTNQIVNKQIISNDLRWDFVYSGGVQIDDHSIVFPSKLHGYLCFARVEFK
jgi:hypothetical protein